MALGLKKFETRCWRWNFYGPCCIASTSPLRLNTVDRFLVLPRFQEALRPHIKRPEGQNEVRACDLPMGKILCMVDFTGCVEVDVARELGLSEQEEHFGDYSPGRYVYLTNNLRTFETPVPVKGMQRFYKVKDPDVETAVIHQLQRLREKVV